MHQKDKRMNGENFSKIMKNRPLNNLEFIP
nr:MAG TPA: hypothetical protein [Caudoviricetes sp.]DAY07490.1 MAG TPA: hypothetical protein [Caudoviricetes sp.]